jgi:hypothetical protein
VSLTATHLAQPEGLTPPTLSPATASDLIVRVTDGIHAAPTALGTVTSAWTCSRVRVATKAGLTVGRTAQAGRQATAQWLWTEFSPRPGFSFSFFPNFQIPFNPIQISIELPKFE